MFPRTGVSPGTGALGADAQSRCRELRISAHRSAHAAQPPPLPRRLDRPPMVAGAPSGRRPRGSGRRGRRARPAPSPSGRCLRRRPLPPAPRHRAAARLVQRVDRVRGVASAPRSPGQRTRRCGQAGSRPVGQHQGEVGRGRGVAQPAAAPRAPPGSRTTPRVVRPAGHRAQIQSRRLNTRYRTRADHRHQHQRERVAQVPVRLGHRVEVHPVHRADQGGREQDGRPRGDLLDLLALGDASPR